MQPIRTDRIRAAAQNGLIKDQSFALDPLGNWTSTTYDTSTETRTHTARNEIETRSGALIEGATGPLNLTFDPSGNLTADGYRSYTWDAYNRLTSATVSMGSPLGTPGAYAYQ